MLMFKKNQNSEASISICYYIQKWGCFNHGQKIVKMSVSKLVDSDPNNSSAREISPPRSSVKICYIIKSKKIITKPSRLKTCC